MGMEVKGKRSGGQCPLMQDKGHHASLIPRLRQILLTGVNDTIFAGFLEGESPT